MLAISNVQAGPKIVSMLRFLFDCLQDDEPPRKKQRMAPVALQLDEHDSGSEDTPESEAEADKTMNRPGKKPKARKTHFNELLTADLLKVRC